MQIYAKVKNIYHSKISNSLLFLKLNSEPPLFFNPGHLKSELRVTAKVFIMVEPQN